ncbi:Cleft lip and palate transmembrane protein 1-like protein [Chionoecetes opilio]|uniref:Lipid scramblase CLPTM1L n=1 Tax=Chionoecetes opilio TaxID=41210 RepID=A0A8J4YF18_CHIOP|nr:Cleft lip and palate transmembrane protein 1-like protein [Chionoecetes opilio]
MADYKISFVQDYSRGSSTICHGTQSLIAMRLWMAYRPSVVIAIGALYDCSSTFHGSYKISVVIAIGVLLWMQFEGALRPMSSLGFSARDLDDVKGIFSDTSLYFLFVTFLVAALHMLFDFLAFKNEMLWRAAPQGIVFLYLMEENTSLLVLVPAAIGGMIELWKVTKAFHIRLEGWRLKVETAISTGESATRELDSQGIRYLSYLLYPLLAIGAVYSLLYTPHRR